MVLWLLNKDPPVFRQVAGVAGNVPKFEKCQAEAPRNRVMRGVSLHVYYIYFGQYADPIGSGRPPVGSWRASNIGSHRYDGCHECEPTIY